jgi:hypothetical protein
MKMKKRKSRKDKTKLLRTSDIPDESPLYLKVQAPGRGQKPENIGELHHQRYALFTKTPHVGVIFDLDEWLSCTTTEDSVFLRIPIELYREITGKLLTNQPEKSSEYNRIYSKLYGSDEDVVKRNPSKKNSEMQRLKDKHEREIAQLLERNHRLDRLVHGLDADFKLSGIIPNFQIPTNTRTIQRLPSGPDYCSIYYDEVKNTMMIDLLEGNFASDIGNISYTETQRKMKRCFEGGGKIITRWLEYVETPTNPYGKGVWQVVSLPMEMNHYEP